MKTSKFKKCRPILCSALTITLVISAWLNLYNALLVEKAEKDVAKILPGEIITTSATEQEKTTEGSTDTSTVYSIKERERLVKKYGKDHPRVKR